MPYMRHDVTKGPKRWERAAKNARLRPHTKAAKLYGSRLLLAEQMTTLAVLGELPFNEHQPFEFLRPDGYSWQPGVELKPVFRTCSVRCTVLQSTVDRGVETLEQAAKVLKGEDIVKVTRYTDSNDIPHERSYTVQAQLRPLDRSTLTRNVRCMCCGATIFKKASDQPPIPTVRVELPEVIHMPCTLEHVERKDYVVAQRGGTILSTDEVWVVKLTERERSILGMVPDPREWAKREGTPIALALAVARQDA